MENFGGYGDVNIAIFRNQVKENDFHYLKGNILIVSDRLYDLAFELHSYMEEATTANMIGIIDTMGDIEDTLVDKIDYIIIVGYLDNQELYSIIDRVRSVNLKVKTVVWAMLDRYIGRISVKYNIEFSYDRLNPVSNFIAYLDCIKEKYDGESADSFFSTLRLLDK